MNAIGRKMLAWALSFLLVAGCCLVAGTPKGRVSAESSGDFEYNILSDGTAEITKYTGSAEELVIPAELDGYTVSSIGSFSFSDSNFVRVTIPDSVTSIGFKAFSDCPCLTEVFIPDSVVNFAGSAFSNCTSLTAILVSDNHPFYSSEDGILFTKNKDVLVAYPTGKSGTYAIPDGVISIGDSAFEGCSGLTQVSIPTSVVDIDNSAFCNCTGLTEITIPDSVNYLGSAAFRYCSSLTEITIPDGVTDIRSYTFEFCNNLTKVDLGSGVANIGDEAFCECTSLTQISIPGNVTKIGYYAFDGCTNLIRADLGNGVATIGNCAFSRCKNLTEVTIPESVTSIANNAFAQSTNLTIYGYTGSYAETYAKDNSIPFVALDAETPNYDLDGNGILNVTDVMTLAMTVVNNTTTPDLDFNGDGEITVLDVMALAQIVVDV